MFAPMRNVLGAYLERNGNKGILITTLRPRSVQRLTAAHEFGHYCLGHKASVDNHDLILGSHHNQVQEAAAQTFALDFLMPENLVDHLLKELGLSTTKNGLRPEHVYTLSLEIGVSYQACLVQLGQLEYLSPYLVKSYMSIPPKKIKESIRQDQPPQENPWSDIWPLDVSHNGRTLNLRVDDRLSLQLDETPSTGFKWNLVNGEPLARLVDDSFESSHNEESVVGMGGHRFFSFLVTESGEDDLRLRLSRPWQPSEEKDKFSIRIIAEGQPQLPADRGLREAARYREISHLEASSPD